MRDRQNNGHNGTLVSWSMQLWGSAIDGSKAEPYRLPGDPDDEDAVFDEDATITSDLPASTPASLLPTKTHIKPTANLPDDHAEATGEATVSFGESYSTIDGPDYETSAPTPTQEPTYPTAITGEDDIESGAEEEYEDEENGYNGGSLYGGTPGYLSGVSSLVGSTTWLFVAGGLIIVFVAGVTAFFWLRKRPGQLGRGGGYDFAPMTDEEDMPMSAMERGGLMGGRGGGGGEGSNPRTRELFNAFALHSDEEDESDDERPRKDGRLAYTDEGVSPFGRACDGLEADSCLCFSLSPPSSHTRRTYFALPTDGVLPRRGSTSTPGARRTAFGDQPKTVVRAGSRTNSEGALQ